jgi:glycosyltransferase involved in cell wall biosynthesis
MGAPGVLRLGDALKLYTTHEYWLICPTHVLFKMDQEACQSKACLKCTLHSLRPPQLWRYTGALGRDLEHVDCVLAPSQFALERHQSDGIRRPMVRLPHFVPVPSPAPDATDAAGPGGNDANAAASPARPYFLYVGRLEKLKGVQDLLRIFEKYQAADLLIVGAGGHEPALRLAARALPHVKFLGALHPSRLAALYRGALGVLVPSLCYETFGLTAAEALMHGTPAIVRRIGALTEIVIESGGGHAFSTDAECISAMERLRTEPAHRRDLAERGQAMALKLWSPDAHLERYLKLVRSMLAGRSQRASYAEAVPAEAEPAIE